MLIQFLLTYQDLKLQGGSLIQGCYIMQIVIYNLTKCGAAIKEPLCPSEQCTLRNGNKNKIANPYLTPSRTSSTPIPQL